MAEHFGALGSLLAPLLDDPALAAEYARGLLQGMDKARFLSAAAAGAAVTDPQLALSFGEGLKARERNEFLTGLASGWARSAVMQPGPGHCRSPMRSCGAQFSLPSSKAGRKRIRNLQRRISP
jgi:hypothetical protein